MLIFKRIAAFKRYLNTIRSNGKTIGFVPTMGALHAGHLELIGKAVDENDVCITSIFVNPAQFNEKLDLEKYPRPFEKDLEKLTASGNHILFLPEVDEMYPAGLDIQVDLDFGFLLKTMEAVFRKGHFEGVIKVMKRLLDIVEPHNLYMGQKDYQQALIVKKMVDEMMPKTELCICETVRENDGLAMSSRNTLLSKEERKAAVKISEILNKARKQTFQVPFDVNREKSIQELNNDPVLKTEYFEFVKKDTLEPLKNNDDPASGIICTAVRAGSVRLIDNMLIS